MIFRAGCASLFQGSPVLRIRSKIFLLLLLVTLPPLAGLIAWTYQGITRIVRELIEQELEALAETQSARILAAVGRSFDRASLVASRTQLRLSFRDVLDEQGDARSAPTRIRRILADAIASVPELRTIDVIDSKGRVRVSTRPEREGSRVAGERWFEGGSSRPSIAPYDPGTGPYGLRVAAPLRLGDRHLGVLAIEEDMSTLRRITGDYTGMGRSGETLLAARDESGHARFLTPRRFEATGRPPIVPRERVDVPITQALLGLEVVERGAIDYRGEPVFAAIRHLEALDWGVVVKIDVAEVLEPERRLVANMIVGCALFVAALLVGGLFFATSISAPIERLRHGVETVTSGDLSQRVASASGDEIGELSRAFDRMTATLDATLVSRDELERSNRELDSFASLVSHDLKEPIRGMRMVAEFLAEDHGEAIGDEGRKKIGRLTALGERAERLIEDLLTYSRLGRVELSVRPTDLDRVVREVLADLSGLLVERAVEVRIPRPLPTLECDGLRIAEVFRNLITNAARYNDKPQRWIEIGMENGEPPVFYVRDNGIGIPREQQERVFGMFQRLHGRDQFGGGTGVGLAAVKKILERLGGWIRVESTPGKGSTFRFTVRRS